MKRSMFASVLALVFAAGCVQTYTIQTPFDPAEHAYAAKPGKAVVSGQAFLRRNDGMVVYAAGSRVFLLPYTSYVREIAATAGGAFGNARLANGDQRLVQYSKVTQANGEGRFSFSGVPDGAYLVVTSVVWMAGNYTQGGDITQLVTVSNGQNVDIVMTR